MTDSELRALLKFIGYIEDTSASSIKMYHPHRLLPVVRISWGYEQCQVEGVYGFISFDEAWRYINKLVNGDVR